MESPVSNLTVVFDNESDPEISLPSSAMMVHKLKWADKRAPDSACDASLPRSRVRTFMEIKRVGSLGFGLIGAGVVLTLVPFFLPVSWHQIPEVFDWPMLLVDRPRVSWLPLNPGQRVITLLLINVTGWALSLLAVWAAWRMLFHKTNTLVRN